jgi:ABC-2 type transport system permease protein
MRLLFHVIRKEFLQLRRDRRMVGMVFIAPLVQLVLFGYAANLDVERVRLLLVDRDRSQESRRLVEAFTGSESFELVLREGGVRDVAPPLERGDADIALVIGEGFGEARASGRPAPVQVVADGADSTSATVGLGYALSILRRESVEPAHAGARMSIVPRVWYNPELRSRWFYVPAILAMALMLVTMISPSMAIVREKEIGTLEQIIVTPLKSWQLIVGKLAPFAILGTIDLLLAAALAVHLFGVPLRGSLATLLLLSLPLLVTLLALGLLVSTLARNQQQAMLTAMFLLMLPMIYLSGLIFPIENMPRPIQLLTYAIPVRYYADVLRGVFLKGSGLDVLWREGAILSGFAVTVLSLAALRFRKRLD